MASIAAWFCESRECLLLNTQQWAHRDSDTSRALLVYMEIKGVVLAGQGVGRAGIWYGQIVGSGEDLLFSRLCS